MAHFCIRVIQGIKCVDWNLRNKDDESALIWALNGERKEIINLILSVPDLEIDIDHLKSKDVFEKAVEACKEYVSVMMDDTTDDAFDEQNILSYALRNNMDSFARLLCRSIFTTLNCIINYKLHIIKKSNYTIIDILMNDNKLFS